jgi:hypothetical protein
MTEERHLTTMVFLELHVPIDQIVMYFLLVIQANTNTRYNIFFIHHDMLSYISCMKIKLSQ